jgi:hypothetical protein
VVGPHPKLGVDAQSLEARAERLFEVTAAVLAGHELDVDDGARRPVRARVPLRFSVRSAWMRSVWMRSAWMRSVWMRSVWMRSVWVRSVRMRSSGLDPEDAREPSSGAGLAVQSLFVAQHMTTRESVGASSEHGDRGRLPRTRRSSVRPPPILRSHDARDVPGTITKERQQT